MTTSVGACACALEIDSDESEVVPDTAIEATLTQEENLDLETVTEVVTQTDVSGTVTFDVEIEGTPDAVRHFAAIMEIVPLDELLPDGERSDTDLGIAATQAVSELDRTDSVEAFLDVMLHPHDPSVDAAEFGFRLIPRPDTRLVLPVILAPYSVGGRWHFKGRHLSFCTYDEGAPYVKQCIARGSKGKIMVGCKYTGTGPTCSSYSSWTKRRHMWTHFVNSSALPYHNNLYITYVP